MRFCINFADDKMNADDVQFFADDSPKQKFSIKTTYKTMIPVISSSIASIFSRSTNDVFRTWCAEQLQTRCNKKEVEKAVDEKLWNVIERKYSYVFAQHQEGASTPGSSSAADTHGQELASTQGEASATSDECFDSVDDDTLQWTTEEWHSET